MSIASLALSLYHSKATHSNRLVLIAIANFEGEDGSWPSHETIGRLAGGINRRTVQRAIDTLIAMRELSEERREGRTNRYRVIITCPNTCDGSSHHREIKGGGVQTTPPQMRHEDATNATEGGGVQTAGGAVSRPPESLINQNNNLVKSLGETKLPDDWQPSERLLEMFQSKWPDVNQELETENFILYFTGEGRKKRDWDKAFQMWMNKAQAHAPKSRNKIDPGVQMLLDEFERNHGNG